MSSLASLGIVAGRSLREQRDTLAARGISLEAVSLAAGLDIDLRLKQGHVVKSLSLQSAGPVLLASRYPADRTLEIDGSRNVLHPHRAVAGRVDQMVRDMTSDILDRIEAHKSHAAASGVRPFPGVVDHDNQYWKTAAMFAFPQYDFARYELDDAAQARAREVFGFGHFTLASYVHDRVMHEVNSALLARALCVLTQSYQNLKCSLVIGPGTMLQRLLSRAVYTRP